jgi:hypothetical protein
LELEVENAFVFKEEHEIGPAFYGSRQVGVEELPNGYTAGQQIQQAA